MWLFHFCCGHISAISSINCLWQSKLLRTHVCGRQVLQLYQITELHHGLMMVGPSGAGKTMAWRVLLEALERLEGVEGAHTSLTPRYAHTWLVWFVTLLTSHVGARLQAYALRFFRFFMTIITMFYYYVEKWFQTSVHVFQHFQLDPWS